jgi:predicted phage terminase large subunit-like protein
MDIHELVDLALKRDLSDWGAANDAFEAVRLLEETDFTAAHRANKTLRSVSARYAAETGSPDFFTLNKKTLLFDAPYDFDAHCRYIEWERDPDKRFYLPRRPRLFPVAQELQKLADGKLKLLAISLPPGVGKTTLAIFFLTWLAGREPDKPILGGSHSNSFLRGVYDECLRIMDPKGEYLWSDVFPKVGVTSTNAQDMKIDLGTPKRFTTLEFSSVGSGNAGKVRAEQLLYCDDLVDGIEAAMSRERMDKLWNLYATDLRQRKIGDCRELHIATRWSVHDVIGRLERQYDGDPEAKFIRIPALNDSDESNFDYGNHAGFTTEMYHEQRDVMDDASWRALYMNEPIEREGQLYNAEELRKYFELPDRDPDAVLAICDTKDKGTDYAFLPVMYQYGQDYYLEDCVCDNGAPEAVEARIVNALVGNKVQMARFESNSAGGRVARDVQKAVKDRGGRCHITTRYTGENKETKIIVNSPWVKEHVLFNEEKIKRDKEYRRMFQFLTGYTMAGKNKHDDVPDGMAMFAIFAQELDGGTVTVFKRKF